MAAILHYESAVYEQKINSFELLNSQLNQHLNTLENYQKQISTFWEGDHTGRFIEAISQAITKVRTASDQVQTLKREYQKIMDEKNRQGDAIDEVIDDVDKAIKTVVGVAGVAAKL